MRPAVEPSRWTRVECPVPGRGRTDDFLTRLLGPVLNSMADDAQLLGWYYERCPGRSIRLHVLDTDANVLVARLTGLVSAVDAAAGYRTRLPPRPVPAGESWGTRLQMCSPGDGAAGRSARDRVVACRCAQLALDVIAATPQRCDRLRTGFDLAAAAVTALRVSSALGLAQLVLRDHRPGTAIPLICPATLGPRRRYRGGPDPLGGWVACLHDLGGGPGVAAELLHLLGNQIGLAAVDVQRIYGALLVSLLDRSRPVSTEDDLRISKGIAMTGGAEYGPGYHRCRSGGAWGRGRAQ
ncbi:MAG TPA: hypothetical protein VJT31_20330 [Rugosimonospora sp.]|nr:hypothetical protein [Rugosimonospora sp.]